MQKTILVLENERTLLMGIREVLEREGYNVLIAENGQRGLEVMQTADSKPDLIVSDIMMPVMDGYEFVKTVRGQRDWLEIPIIYLTAKTERTDINEGRRLGVDDYLIKPFIPEELLLAVNAKLERKKQIQDYHEMALRDLRANIMTILNHEFRTPLTYIVGYNEMLRVNPEDITAADLRTILPKIDQGAQRLRRLVENFIFLVDLETDSEGMGVTLTQTIDDYGQVLGQLLANYRDQADQAGIQFNVEIAANAPSIVSDPDYLIKIVDCLLDNAFKFTPSGGNIWLRFRPYHSSTGIYYLKLDVTDSGQGVGQEHIPHIFEPFYQATRQDDEHPGTGTGLAIVKGLVDLQRGEVRVESQLGAGSTFSVYIPA